MALHMEYTVLTVALPTYAWGQIDGKHFYIVPTIEPFVDDRKRQ